MSGGSPAPDSPRAEPRTGSGDGRLWLAVAALVGAVPLLRCAGIDPAGSSAAHDLAYYYVPLYEATFEWLASGRLPLWNPYHLTGRPWLATLQPGVFYPPHALYAALPSHAALLATTLLHLLLAALATALFARRMGLGRAAALLAAVAFASRGALMDWTRFPSLLEAAAWLPTGCLAVWWIARGGRPTAGVALLALATGLSFLAGYPQGTLLLLYAWASLLVALLVGSRTPARGWLAPGAALAAGIALGAGLAAVELLPAFELTREGTRSVETLSPERTWSATAAHFFDLGWALRGQVVSMGAVLLALAPAALLARPRRTLALWSLGLAAVSYVLASGARPELIDAYRALPGLGWFRQPQRLVLLTQFGVAIAAALGLDALLARRGTGPSAGAPRYAPATLAALALVLGGFAFARGDGVSGAGAVAAALLLGAAAAARAPAALLATGLVALVWVDAALSPGRRGTASYRAEATAGYRNNDPFYAELAARAGPDRVTSMFLKPILELKRGAHHGLRWLEDFEPMNLRRQSEYFEYFQSGRPGPVRKSWGYSGAILPLWQLNLFRYLREGDAVPAADAWSRRRLLDLAAVRWIIAPAAILGRPGTRRLVAEQGLVPRASPDPRFALFENSHALPRAFVTHHIRPAPPTAELLRRLSQPDFDPYAETYVEGDPELPPLRAGPAAPAGGPAALVRDDATRVEVEAVLEVPGLLVLADAYARGWRASVDGEPRRIFPANHLFRGVPLAAGRHRVRFEYRAPGFAAGAATSALAGLAWLALWARRRRR